MKTQLEVNRAFREYANEFNLSLRKITLNGKRVLNTQARVAYQDHLDQLVDTSQITLALACRSVYS